MTANGQKHRRHVMGKLRLPIETKSSNEHSCLLQDGKNPFFLFLFFFFYSEQKACTKNV